MEIFLVLLSECEEMHVTFTNNNDTIHYKFNIYTYYYQEEFHSKKMESENRF